MEKHLGKSGFTLVELLVVIAVMAILGTIVLGSSRMLIQTAREHRTRTTRDALNVALHRYRTEYQEWPVSKSDAKGQPHDKREGTSAYNGYEWYQWKEDNWKIFDELRAVNNPDKITFLDEAAVYTSSSSGEKVIPLADAAGNTGHSLYYAMKRDNKSAPFLVWICFETDEAEVGPRDGSFQAGYISEEDKAYGY